MTLSPFKRTSLAIGLALMAPMAAWSQVSLSVNLAPPPLPLYAQPPIPGDGYLWTPGYWAWDAAAGDYVWVPGTWAQPPGQGLLWTPGYWAFFNAGYVWHRGYWGSHVGYYGGLNYGYGYGGHGYLGGRWNGGHFRYNTAVNNIPSGRVHDVYRMAVAQQAPHGESYNGGNSHDRTQPTASQRQFEGSTHGAPTQAQRDHEHGAFGMPEQRLGNNHGNPPTAATPRPGGFGDPQVEHARTAPEAHAGGGRAMGGGHPGGGERPGGGGHPDERR